MADSVAQEYDSSRLAYDVKVSEISVITSAGVDIKIDFLLDELNIYEDIFSNTISGEISIIDSGNYISRLNFHGNEYLSIKFGTPYLKPYDKVFRIYKISNVELQTQSTLKYKIHFCSEEFIVNQEKKVSKSYQGLQTSQIILDIAKTYLGVSPSKLNLNNIEQSVGIKNIIIPNMRPLEAINWLASISINDVLSSAFLFYENRDGFNFKSLDNIFNGNIRKALRMGNKNTDNDAVTNQFYFDDFQITQSFDLLNSISSGAYSSEMYKLDLLRQQVDYTKFDPASNSFKTLNTYLPFNLARNRFNQSLLDSTAYTRYFVGVEGDLTDKWLLQRASQFSLLNSYKMNIQISGDSELKVGDMLELSFPDMGRYEESSQISEDPFKSGLFLVTTLRHTIIRDKYFCYAQICRDSVKENVLSYVPGTRYEEVKKL
jgi:hypothetical protein